MYTPAAHELGASRSRLDLDAAPNCVTGTNAAGDSWLAKSADSHSQLTWFPSACTSWWRQHVVVHLLLNTVVDVAAFY